MPVVHIREIEDKMDCLDVIAEVTGSTGARNYSKGKYINVDLLDDGCDIKLTLFDALVSKVENIEVNIFVCIFCDEFFFEI